MTGASSPLNPAGLGHCHHLGVWTLEWDRVAVGKGKIGKGRKFLIWKESLQGNGQARCLGKLAPAKQEGEGVCLNRLALEGKCKGLRRGLLLGKRIRKLRAGRDRQAPAHLPHLPAVPNPG